jgi:hypothetical protein
MIACRTCPNYGLGYSVVFAAQDLAHLNEDHVDLIKRLMHGSKEPEQAYPAAPWLFDVVSAQSDRCSTQGLLLRSCINSKPTANWHASLLQANTGIPIADKMYCAAACEPVNEWVAADMVNHWR